MDIRIENHGSIVLLQPMNQEARGWLEENLAEGPLWGDASVVEPRYVAAIVEGARDAGLEVG